MPALNLAHLITASLCILLSAPVRAEIVDLLPRIKPAIVGVGTLHPLVAPRIRLLATGFAVADGLNIITNAHAIPAKYVHELLEQAGLRP
jgi:hypothetical protein